MGTEITEMQKFTAEEFEADFDNLMRKVEEEGESYIITNENGNVIMMPYKEYDSLTRIYTDHDEAC